MAKTNLLNNGWMSKMQRSARVKLLAALESKNGKKWIALYEDNSFNKPTYYCTTDSGGENLGLDKREAAARVIAIAAQIKPKVHKLDITPEVEALYS